MQNRGNKWQEIHNVRANIKSTVMKNHLKEGEIDLITSTDTYYNLVLSELIRV